MRDAGGPKPAPYYLTKEMFGGLPFELAFNDWRDLASRVDTTDEVPHSHAVPEVYALLSSEPGDAVIEVEVEGVNYEVVSPAVFYTPAKQLHRFRTKKAEPGSFLLGIAVTTPAAGS
jgi:hypothetical protein